MGTQTSGRGSPMPPSQSQNESAEGAARSAVFMRSLIARTPRCGADAAAGASTPRRAPCALLATIRLGRWLRIGGIGGTWCRPLHLHIRRLALLVRFDEPDPLV